MIKKLLIVLLMIPMLVSAASSSSSFGLGIILGEPTGISFKKWLTMDSAIDGAAAWSFVGDAALRLHADYLLHTSSLDNLSHEGVLFYYGIGIKVKFAAQSQVGGRIPLGITYEFPKAPLDAFFEIVPGLELIPATKFTLAGAIGMRYYF
ncbi:MAG TPA: hypothetical protein ENK44_03095 [Caldithrix abyssi]|uniref:DUF3996 domain-containing protein n=1 Tax=Caldithrix abyssi TaxID=187145 RepID=A0A7V4TYD8_CALAY|nr:hypothetical protein [Caldithrix abyssi]